MRAAREVAAWDQYWDSGGKGEHIYLGHGTSEDYLRRTVEVA